MVGKNEAMFPIVEFLAYQILGIIRSQIEIEFFSFFNRDIYKLKEMLFIIKKFKEIDICEKKLIKWC